MKPCKKFLPLLLALTLVLSAFSACGKQTENVVAEATPAETTAASVETTTAPAAEAEAPAEQVSDNNYYQVGDKIDDFTATTYDGKEISLYQVLEEKDLVLLNMWGTFCGPCAAEFPVMQEAYEQYRDKVEIIALSTSEADTDEVLAAYVQEKGMTFPVGRDTVGLYSRIHTTSVPATLLVDRFGTICMIEIGGITDIACFLNMFDIYTAEDYTESIFMPSAYSELPTAQPADPSELNAALNGEGGSLVFTNSTNKFYWPMTVEEKDGRTVAAASNAEHYMSMAVVETQVEAKAGDVLVMDYKLMSDCLMSTMRITVDGEQVKASAYNQDWTTFAYRFEESGSHRISVAFKRNYNEYEGKDGLWIDSIRLVSGDEADKAIANNPLRPVSEEFTLTFANENVENAMIVLEETGEPAIPVYLCTDPTIRLKVTLPEDMEPDMTFVEDFDYNTFTMVPSAEENCYLIELVNNDRTVCNPSNLLLFNDGVVLSEMYIFDSYEEADVYAAWLGDHVGLKLKTVPWDDSMVMEAAPEGDGTYTVTYVDQNGDPVPGVMCQVCDESTCQVFVSDENGVCLFTLPAGHYEIHTLSVPAGYEGDTETVTEAPANGGELSFTLTKK